MALFAFSLLFGALLASIDLANPRLRESIRDSIPGLWPRLTWALLLIIVFFASLYLVFYLDYYQVEAPSTGFRRFTFFKRALEQAPMMLAAAAVSFYAIRWLHLSTRPGERNVIPRGIGIAGAGLLILGLFLLEDWRGSPLVQKLNTPVFSLEFAPEKDSVRPGRYLPEFGQKTSSPTDPVQQSLYLLDTLGGAIDRDEKYIRSFAMDPTPPKIIDTLYREKSFYRDQIGPLADCLKAIRSRVRDRDPLIIVDSETARTLRELHRLNLELNRLNLPKVKAAASGLSDITMTFNRIGSDFESNLLTRLRETKDRRVDQHRWIYPPFRDYEENIDMICKPIDEAFVQRLYSPGRSFSASMPYFSLATAAMLNAINERLAAVEEIDAWLKYHDEEQSSVVPGSAQFIIDRVFKLRVEFWAGSFLEGDPEYVDLGLRRYQKAIDAVDDIFRNSLPRTKWTMSLERLFREVDVRGKSQFCSDLDENVKRILFSAINMVNTVVAYAVVNDLRVLSTDYSNDIVKYHDFLGFVDDRCFHTVFADKVTELRQMAELTDTYLTAKRARLRELPEERVRFELCGMKSALGRADEYIRELERDGGQQKDYVAAEEFYELARSLKRSVTAFNEASAKTGPRGCLVDVEKAPDDKSP